MGCYKIHWKESAKKELKKLDKTMIKRLLEQIDLLAENPRPLTCKKLQGMENFYRVRVADYRVIYSIEDNVLKIEIIRIGHRRNIYQNLGKLK
jgi:mRNA interferase RelE/StbE